MAVSWNINELFKQASPDINYSESFFWAASVVGPCVEQSTLP